MSITSKGGSNNLKVSGNAWSYQYIIRTKKGSQDYRPIS